MKDFLEFNKIEGTTYLWNTKKKKAMLNGKFIALSAHIKKVEKAHTSDLTAHLKTQEQKEADSLRRNR